MVVGAATAERARAAGMEDVFPETITTADLILSIVPPTPGITRSIKEFQALKRKIVAPSRNKANAADNDFSITVTSRAIYEAIFAIKSRVKSSAELIPSLKKGPRAMPVTGRLYPAHSSKVFLLEWVLAVPA